MHNLLALLAPQSSALDFRQRVSPKEAAFVFLLGLLLALLRFAALYGIAIHPDEAYYWTWSRRLDWAYYDLNLGIAFYIRLFTSLLGENYLALKLAAIFPFPFSLFPFPFSLFPFPFSLFPFPFSLFPFPFSLFPFPFSLFPFPFSLFPFPFSLFPFPFSLFPFPFSLFPFPFSLFPFPFSLLRFAALSLLYEL